MADLIFYTHPMSRGRIARWMLEEVGAPYETHVIGYGAQMKGEEYRAVNPMGKVPAIVHHGRTVTECAAICAYLAEAFPETGLAPREAERADYFRWLFFAAGPVEQAVTNHANGWDPPAERRRMFGYGSFDEAIDTLADHFVTHRYVCGDRFTAADVYVGSQVLWGTQFGTMPERGSFSAYAERLRERDAYRQAGEKDNALVAQMKASEVGQ